MGFGLTDFLTLLGALGLFLYGMKVMSDSLMELAGKHMRSILASLTSNRVFGIFTGFVITAVIQSSSATTLMVVGFSNAGLLSLAESVSVIMGANIGTTITAWLITILGFKVSMSAIALPLVGLGFLMSFSKKVRLKNWGMFIIGFSVLFIGLQFLKDTMPDIKQNPGVLEWLKEYIGHGFWSVILFVFIGTLLTVLVQSSSAIMALTLVMCYEGWIPFDMAAAMVLGQNVGTTVTANLAALVANTNAKRTARAHLIFNVIGVLWMLILFYPFLHGVGEFVVSRGSESPFITATAIPVALSVFHTVFNVLNTLILVWFVPQIVRVAERWIPKQEEHDPELGQPKFLSNTALNYPQTAIQALLKESKRLFNGPVFEIVSHAANLHQSDLRSTMKPKKLIKKSTEIIHIDIDEFYYSKVKTIYSKIIEFGTRILTLFNMTPELTESVNNIKQANRLVVEAIKDSRALKSNLDKYMLSDNDYMKHEYDLLRKKTARVLRQLYLISEDENPGQHVDDLNKLRHKLKRGDALLDGSIDSLIREQLITPEMAGSLANDNSIVADIGKNLLDAANLLYIKGTWNNPDWMNADLSPSEMEDVG